VPERDIRLLIDEDVWDGLAAALREAGYDAVSVAEIGRKGFSANFYDARWRSWMG